MVLTIKMRGAGIEIGLLKKEKLIDKTSWKDRRDMLERFLPEVDKLLGRNNITARDLQEVRTDIKVNKSHSSYRIVRAAVLSFEMGIREKR
ncbi:MAG: hypothetical protein ABIC19_00370 [Patescibacteria group bacterium]|nr:hypothetical protein [Patescibacteria group bacterium]